MKKEIILLGALLIGALGYGQNLRDGLRYSTEDLNGSSRYKGLSGAFGSIGGELSAISINPAGGAVFSSSEIGISFGEMRNKKEGISYFGGNNTTKNSDFNLTQFGLITVFDNNPDAKWKKFNIAFNYMNSKDFSLEDIRFAGGNVDKNLGDYFKHFADGISQQNLFLEDYNGKTVERVYTIGDLYANPKRDPFKYRNALLGHNTKLISPAVDKLIEADHANGLLQNTDATKPYYFDYNEWKGKHERGEVDYSGLGTDYPNYLADAILQTQEYYNAVGVPTAQYFDIKREGGMSKYNFNFSTQYGEDLFLGLNLNSHTVNYREIMEHREIYANGSNIKDAFFRNEIHTTGTGFSFQLGAIAKVGKGFRLGASYSSPTWYTLEDETTQSLSTNGGLYVADPNMVVVYEPYKFRTPGSWTASGSYFFGNRGFVSLDYIYKGYGNMRFRTDYLKPENDIIENELGDTNTIRLGGEFRVTKEFSLRAGYRWEQSPYKNVKYVGDVNGYSFGLGYAFSGVRLDVSYDVATQKNMEQMYESVITTPAKYTSKRGYLLFTLSAKLF